MHRNRLSVLSCLVALALISLPGHGVKADDIPLPPFPNGKDVRYGETRDQSITIYRARSRQAAPVVLLIGDPLPRFGSANAQLSFLITGLMDRGIAVVGINVPGKTLADDAENIKKALRFVGSRASVDRLDLSRLAVLGRRSGGQLAALIATDPAYLAEASLSFAALRSAAVMDGTLYQPGGEEDEDAGFPAAARAKYLGEDAMGRNLSPFAHLAAPNAPALLLVNLKPKPNRARVANELGAGLRKSGSQVIVKNMVSGDGLTTGAPSERTTRDVLAFLLVTLR